MSDDLRSLLPLLFKGLLGLLNFFILLAHPDFKFFLFSLVSTRRELLLRVHLVDVLLLGLLAVLDGFFSDLQHLWVVVHVEFFGA